MIVISYAVNLPKKTKFMLVFKCIDNEINKA